MPYDQLEHLPTSVKNSLPAHAQEIYLAAFNNAWEGYKDPEKRRGDDDRETVAHKVAWDAVKQVYEKKGDDWQKNS